MQNLIVNDFNVALAFAAFGSIASPLLVFAMLGSYLKLCALKSVRKRKGGISSFNEELCARILVQPPSALTRWCN